MFGKTNARGGGGGANSGVTPTIMPPSQKPMNRMKRPMPTPIARFRPSGTAFMIASRRPTTTSRVMMRPSITITPIAEAGRHPQGGQREGHHGVQAEAGGQGERIVRGQAHEQGHESGDKCRAGGDGDRVKTQRSGDDRRVHGDDVDHHQECGNAGPNLGADVRPPFAQVEPALHVRTASSTPPSRLRGGPWANGRDGCYSGVRARESDLRMRCNPTSRGRRISGAGRS